MSLSKVKNNHDLYLYDRHSLFNSNYFGPFYLWTLNKYTVWSAHKSHSHRMEGRSWYQSFFWGRAAFTSSYMTYADPEKRHMNDQQLELTMIINSTKCLCLLRHVLNIMSNYAACTKNLPYIDVVGYGSSLCKLLNVLQYRSTTARSNTPSTVRPIVAR